MSLFHIIRQLVHLLTKCFLTGLRELYEPQDRFCSRWRRLDLKIIAEALGVLPSTPQPLWRIGFSYINIEQSLGLPGFGHRSKHTAARETRVSTDSDKEDEVVSDAKDF